MKPSSSVLLFTLALILVLVNVGEVKATVGACQYCRYCQFCSHCESCPCEPAPGNFCDHCKYCKYCSLCKLCDTACNEDTYIGSFFGKVGSFFDSFRAAEVEQEEKPDLATLDENLRRKFEGNGAQDENQKEL